MRHINGTLLNDDAVLWKSHLIYIILIWTINNHLIKLIKKYRIWLNPLMYNVGSSWMLSWTVAVALFALIIIFINLLIWICLRVLTHAWNCNLSTALNSFLRKFTRYYWQIFNYFLCNALWCCSHRYITCKTTLIALWLVLSTQLPLRLIIFQILLISIIIWIILVLLIWIMYRAQRAYYTLRQLILNLYLLDLLKWMHLIQLLGLWLRLFHIGCILYQGTLRHYSIIRCSIVPHDLSSLCIFLICY